MKEECHLSCDAHTHSGKLTCITEKQCNREKLVKMLQNKNTENRNTNMDMSKALFPKDLIENILFASIGVRGFLATFSSPL